MWFQHLKFAYRDFLRYKIYSFINLSGLSIGIIATILIIQWTQDELSKDRFQQKTDQIYLVRTWQQYGSIIQAGSGTPPAFNPVLEEGYPAIHAEVCI